MKPDNFVPAEWLFESCFDYAQDFLIAELQDSVFAWVRRIQENVLTRPDMVSVGAIGDVSSLCLDGREVSMLVESAFKHGRHTPVYIRVTVGSAELIAKKHKEIGASINRCGGGVFAAKFPGPN
jgi:hypothetical protein